MSQYGPRPQQIEPSDDDGDVLTTVGGVTQWAPSASGIQTIVPGSNVTVDDTDPLNPIVNALADIETIDEAITALPSKVHRWKFDESSGASVADSVGSLGLTLSGTYTRNVTTPGGKGTTFGAGAFAVSSGLGSLPVGAAARCILIIFKTDAVYSASVERTLFAYGTTAARALCMLTTDSSGGANRPNVFALAGTDAALLGNTLASDTKWHVGAFGVVPNRGVIAYLDGDQLIQNASADLNTTNSGNFHVGETVAGAVRFLGDIDEVVAMNAWPGKASLDRLYRALQNAL